MHLQMRFRALLVFLLTFALQAAVPTPKEHFGYTPGDDYKLADWDAISGYFLKVAKSSDRILVKEFGRTSEGRPMYVAFISTAENLKRLEEYREINRKLALGLVDANEARTLAQRGKAIVWIDSGLHASEVAPAQHSPELVYRMLIDESEETKRIRENVILMQIPCINPDGLDMVAHWYAKNVGTPYELAPLPWLYQKYAGHDNNRDWFMLNLPETRNVSRLLFREWFPQIVYNQHQAPAFPARIFVPPYAEPLNPNIPAPVMEGINLIGAAMKERFARENKPGVLSYFGFDAWWNGGLRSVPAFHNMHGILTETAGFQYGTPKTYKASEIPERFGNGIPTHEPTVFYERPWLGGKWGVRDAIEYMLTGDFAILDLASTRREQFLYKAWETAYKNRDLGAAGKPYAYIVAQDQWDPTAARELLRRLQMSGVSVSRAAAPFQANGKSYSEGTYVIPASQPFRGYVVDLLEPQKYPELKSGTTGPTKRPYDIAGWTLPMQMNVKLDRVESKFEARLEDSEDLPPITTGKEHRDTGSLFAVADAVAAGKGVQWKAGGATYALKKPRVGVYQPWVANIDSGWTEWLLDTFKIPQTVLRNEDIRKGALNAQFDTIILSQQSAESILHGTRAGERMGGRTDYSDPNMQQRPEYTGGIELQGLANLDEFVRNGGTLIALDNATELPVKYFPLPVRLLLTPQAEGPVREEASSATAYYCPGSLLRIDVETANAVALGVPKEAIAFSSGGQAFETTLLDSFNKGDNEVKIIARYAKQDLLASGWISGERAVLGRPILVEARHGKGKVILYGFRPQFRGQPYGTFKLLLNAIYLASAEKQ